VSLTLLVVVFNILVLLGMFFLIVQHFLQSEEILSSLLIQFLLDVSVNIYEFWNDDVFQSVDSSVGDLDFFVQCQEGCLNLSIKYLKAGNIDQQTQDRSEFLSAFLD
jgi:hypothetical protein